jgi:hypothetical protein
MPRQLLLGLLLTAGLCAGEAAADPPFADATVADGTRLIAHWEASVYGRLWNDPLFASRREQWLQPLSELQTGVGLTLREALQAMKGVAMQALAPAADQQPLSRVLFEAELGAVAARVMQALRMLNSDPAALKDLKQAGAAEAFELVAHRLRIARIATMLVAGSAANPAPARAWKPTALPPLADLALHLDATRLLAILPGEQAKQIEAVLKPLAHAAGDIDYRLELVPEGLHERIASHAGATGTVAVDRELLSRLPGKTLFTLALALDGKALWEQTRTAALSEFAVSNALPSPEAAEQAIDQQLAAMGLTTTVAQLVEGLHGTVVLVVTPGIPFPSPTLMLPRSAAFDQLVGLVLKTLSVNPPLDGQGTMLPLPGLQIPVQLAATKEHWLLGSDITLITAWLAGTPGGWCDTAPGKTALAHAPPKATVIGSSDTPAVLTTIAGYAALMLNGNAGLTPQDKQALMQGLNRLAALSSTGWLVAYPDNGLSVIEDRGLIGFGALAATAVIADLAFTKPKADQPDAAAAAAVTVMTTQLLPGEQAFQKGLYLDQDGDGKGEFGLLSELCGQRATPNAPVGVLQLVDSKLAGGPVDGYRFAIYLPDGKGGAASEPAGAGPRPANQAAAREQARHFVAYAWPVSTAAAAPGGRMFAITEAGVLYSAPASGRVPAWNELFAGAGWETAPSWARYQPEAHAKAAGPSGF